jgi:hypothetical protein
MEKVLGFVKNFYLQIMEDEYTLIRSPIMDKTKWIEKLKYDVLRFSIDSVDLSLIEIGNAVNVQVRTSITHIDGNSVPLLKLEIPKNLYLIVDQFSRLTVLLLGRTDSFMYV